MTWALCFNCGATKFGAICPCPECQRASTGDMGLDIAFSDHHWSEATLKAFGEVVRSLRRVGADDELRFWSFVRYVSVNHPEILTVDLPPERQHACDMLLARADPPPVVLEESWRGARALAREADGGAGSPSRRKRPWWRFWG